MKHVNSFDSFINEGAYPYHFISQQINSPKVGKFENEDAIIFNSTPAAFELKGGRKGPFLKQLDVTIKEAGVKLKYALDKSSSDRAVALYGAKEDLKAWVEKAYIGHPASSTETIGKELIKSL
jgi:hypothetical protein